MVCYAPNFFTINNSEWMSIAQMHEWIDNVNPNANPVVPAEDPVDDKCHVCFVPNSSLVMCELCGNPVCEQCYEFCEQCELNCCNYCESFIYCDVCDCTMCFHCNEECSHQETSSEWPDEYVQTEALIVS